MRNVFGRLAGIFAVFFLLTANVAAQENEWRVVEMSGVVRATQPMASMQAVSTSSILTAGTVLSTGIDGRVALMRGEQEIVVGPNSRMSLPAVEEPGMTRVIQDLGTLLFKVDKRKTKHFRVETPIIAAVVKGTTFTVTAGADVHAVHVAEGAVEVASRNGAARALVTAGRTAFVSRSNPSAIQFDAAGGQKHSSAVQKLLDADDGATNRGVTSVEKASLDASKSAAADRRDWLVPTDISAEMADVTDLSAGAVQFADKPNGLRSDRGRDGDNWSTSDNLSRAGARAALTAHATHMDQLTRRQPGAERSHADNGNDHAFAGDGNNGNGPNANANAGGVNANANTNINTGAVNANANVNAGLGGEGGVAVNAGLGLGLGGGNGNGNGNPHQ